MNRQQTLQTRKSAKPVLAERFGVTRLALSGSAARGGTAPGQRYRPADRVRTGKVPSLWYAAELQDAFYRLFVVRHVDMVPPEVLRNPTAEKPSNRT